MVPHEVLTRRDADAGGAALFLPRGPCHVPDIACPITAVGQNWFSDYAGHAGE